MRGTRHLDGAISGKLMMVPPTGDHMTPLCSEQQSLAAGSTDTTSPSSLVGIIEEFLVSRRAANCSNRALEVYENNLQRFARAVDAEMSAHTRGEIERYLLGLGGHMKPISVHQHYRTLGTFFSWCVDVGVLAANPMRGVKMRIPKTFPRVPDDETVRQLITACADTFEGRRNKALVALLADSGLRISEALRLHIENVNLANHTLLVHGGKGGHDGDGFFGAETARMIREWLGVRRKTGPADYLFVDRQGRPLSRYNGTHILHRLSSRAGLAQKVGPHALRHYAATSVLRSTDNLDLARRVLRHQSLTTTTRYIHLTKSDVLMKFKKASPVDNLRAGR